MEDVDQQQLARLRLRLEECEEPVLQQMLEDRLAELTGASPYRVVRDDLERNYVTLRDALGAGTKEFRDRWATLRANMLQTHGWTEKDFYAEMDRRADWRKR